MLKKTTAGAVLLLTALAATAAAQTKSVPQRVSVPFKFSFMEKEYPAAMYFFRHDGASDQVELLGQNKTLLSRVRVITRLAPTPGAKPDGNVRLVFDQVGEDRYLSEIWIPGQDGLLVRATSERHNHQVAEGGTK